MESQATNNTLRDAVYTFAAAEMSEGISFERLEDMLRAKGLDLVSATRLVNSLIIVRTQAARSAGKRSLLFGALCCAAGLLAFAWAYSGMAVIGGIYAVAATAVASGTAQIVQGAMRMNA